MMVSRVDSHTAKRIAIQLLSQHFSIQKIDVTLQDETWLVSALVESYGKTGMEKIKINSETGAILQVTMEQASAA